MYTSLLMHGQEEKLDLDKTDGKSVTLARNWSGRVGLGKAVMGRRWGRWELGYVGVGKNGTWAICVQ